WLGGAATLFFTLIGQLTIRYVSVSETAVVSNLLQTLFKLTPRIALGSLIAYLFSQTINIEIYSYIQKIKPKKIWFRSAIANIVGQFFDSIIFFSIAFYGIIPFQTFIDTGFVGFIVKVSIGLLGIPFLYFSYRIKTTSEIIKEE